MYVFKNPKSNMCPKRREKKSLLIPSTIDITISVQVIHMLCHLSVWRIGSTMCIHAPSVFFSPLCSGGESIRVFVRVRPPDPNLECDLDHAHCLEVSSLTSLSMKSHPEPKVFTFDHVAGMHTTQVCYNITPGWACSKPVRCRSSKPPLLYAWIM